MSNSNLSNETKTKWWQINIALWLLVGLLLLYFKLPTTPDLIKNTIVGGLIFALIVFLGVEVPKLLKISLMTALKQTQNALISQISKQLEDVVIKAREEREAERKELIQSIAGGKIVQQLTNNMKKAGHEDLELYRFLGLKGEQENKSAFNNSIFQDFDLRGANQNAVYFLWVNTSTNPPSEINAKINRANKFLTVSFKSYSIGGANVAIRASGDVARLRDNRRRYLTFDLRLRRSKESDSEEVEVGFRVVNGWLQHWHYSSMPTEGYIKAKLKNYCQFNTNDQSESEQLSTWETFYLDLENPELWHLFTSDGNYLYGPKSADFEIICAIIFEVGCRDPQGVGTLDPKPGIGEGKLDIANIRLSQTMEGHSLP